MHICWRKSSRWRGKKVISLTRRNRRKTTWSRRECWSRRRKRWTPAWRWSSLRAPSRWWGGRAAVTRHAWRQPSDERPSSPAAEKPVDRSTDRSPPWSWFPVAEWPPPPARSSAQLSSFFLFSVSLWLRVHKNCGGNIICWESLKMRNGTRGERLESGLRDQRDWLLFTVLPVKLLVRWNR